VSRKCHRFVEFGFGEDIARRLQATNLNQGRATQDYVFDEDGMIAGTTGWASGLRAKQQLNARHGRPINDLTEMFYAKLGLRSENP
jgi:hypothetical protein